ncbi:hypothetical protein [Bradyrhizobium phage BDU-MI-1]|nr:hypothetical protein [Bradyrhizobium phage BDU-MI-1]
MSVGQSKAIRARQGKMNRMIDKAHSLVDFLNPHTNYVASTTVKLPHIVSERLRDAVESMKPQPELDVVNCTYTTTVQLDEPVEHVGDDEMQAMVKFLADEMERELFRQMTGGEYAESLRAAKVDVGQRNSYGKSLLIADLANLT